jgi:hypothetical protein
MGHAGGPFGPRLALMHMLMGYRYLAVLLTIMSSACFVRGRQGLSVAGLETAFVTATILSTTGPPPPKVTFVPEVRPGYAWQPGYWTLQGESWLWIDGGWVSLRPGYAWTPTHWEQVPDGTWQLMQGHLVPVTPDPGSSKRRQDPADVNVRETEVARSAVATATAG